MVPWPIALLALWYGVLAEASAAMVWKILTHQLQQPLLWGLAWLGLSAGTMIGLALLKAWARKLAVFGAFLMTLLTLSIAGLLVMNGRPLGGALATVAAGVQVVVIRYLRRQTVKAYFA